MAHAQGGDVGRALAERTTRPVTGRVPSSPAARGAMQRTVEVLRQDGLGAPAAPRNAAPPRPSFPHVPADVRIA